ncbi:hypothetical protein D918_04234 [Trichuris suis]|nr:hypothetical protein D918_04234 [Trichuris suis]
MAIENCHSLILYEWSKTNWSFQFLPLAMGCLKHSCGNTHGCMFKPAGCEWDKCEMIFGFQPKDDFIDFDITYQLASPDMAKNRYISVGFSDTQDMDRTATVHCVFPIDREPTIGLGYTVGHKYLSINDPTAVSQNVKLLNVTSIEGKFGCAFSRKIVPTTLRDKILPLNTPRYLLVAIGKMDASGEEFRIHPTDPTARDYPYVSSMKTDFSSHDSIHATNSDHHNHVHKPTSTRTVKRILKLTHGSLMILGWWFFVASAILCARFLKQYKSERNFFGIKLWFLLHRTLNIVAIVLIAVAFILIFIAEDGQWAGSDFPKGTHSILGMTASIGIFLQPIVAYFRCAPHDSKRVIFNWGHGLLGYLVWCCAAASIFMITYPPFSYNFKVTDQFGAAPLALMIVLCVSFVLAMALLEGCRIAANILKGRKSAYQTNRLMKASPRGELAMFQLSAQLFLA